MNFNHFSLINFIHSRNHLSSDHLIDNKPDEEEKLIKKISLSFHFPLNRTGSEEKLLSPTAQLFLNELFFVYKLAFTESRSSALEQYHGDPSREKILWKKNFFPSENFPFSFIHFRYGGYFSWKLQKTRELLISWLILDMFHLGAFKREKNVWHEHCDPVSKFQSNGEKKRFQIAHRERKNLHAWCFSNINSVKMVALSWCFVLRWVMEGIKFISLCFFPLRINSLELSNSFFLE